MKKNFINPEIKISLFNQERIRTVQEVDPMETVGPTVSAAYNFNDALRWLKDDKGFTDATNIISFKE